MQTSTPTRPDATGRVFSRPSGYRVPGNSAAGSLRVHEQLRLRGREGDRERERKATSFPRERDSAVLAWEAERTKGSRNHGDVQFAGETRKCWLRGNGGEDAFFPLMPALHRCRGRLDDDSIAHDSSRRRRVSATLIAPQANVFLTCSAGRVEALHLIG